ncbi:unnamed protein product [Mycena citricolor]|uniref:Uncharacterized protein n=1 Tax=Mycena citricolor TaxID=2018698 RepID=A0AAD2HJ41_9AGAR|nr:unnamed protein product [Mycena citricolor]
MSIAQGLSSAQMLVSEPSPHVLHVQLSRKPVNAFTTEFWKEYGDLFDRITREARDVRAVVLSSAFPKLFTAGIDVGELSASLENTDFPDPARRALSSLHHVHEFQHAIGAPDRCPVPVIAAVHGLVVGLGIDIISACDIRYGAENSRFTIKEVDVGLAADIGTLSYLPKITANHSLAKELAYTSRFFTASDALRLGLLSTVVPGGKDEVVKAALELAAEIASKSPLAVSGTKRILNHARDHSIEENLEYTAIWNSAALQTKDIPESLLAVKEKRQAEYAPLMKPKL